jgi:hypothetical protein
MTPGEFNKAFEKAKTEIAKVKAWIDEMMLEEKELKG